MSLPSKIQIGDYAGHDVQSLADQPGMSAAELKTVFDYVTEQVVIPKVNAGIDSLSKNFLSKTVFQAVASGSSGEKQIGVTTPFAGGPENGQVYLDALFAYMKTGWIPDSDTGHTWTYVSTDNPTGVLSLNWDASKWTPGYRIKFDNNGNTIKGIVTPVGQYTSGATQITFLHEINQSTMQAKTLMNSASPAISNMYYSNVKCSMGFPSDRANLCLLSSTSPITQGVINASKNYIRAHCALL